jgi:hypothetical protein
MTGRRNVISGIVLLGVVAAVITYLGGQPPPPPPPTPFSYSVLNVYGGYRYFEDEEIMAILHDRYALDVAGELRKGTFDMADDYQEGVDCIFPGSKTGVDYFEAEHPGVIRRSEAVFQSPIVVYTWKEFLPSLEQADLVYTRDGVYFLRMKPLIDAMYEDKQWLDLGVDIPGYVNVESTDPLESSSGMIWMALMASYLVPGNETGGRVVKADDLIVNDILPVLRKYWENQGNQTITTGKLFPRFITTGAGMPMIVAYENSYIGWYEALLDDQKPQADRIVGIYPEVTISTEHSLASLTVACDQLLEVFMTDAEIQRLAWNNYGMRNSAGGIGARPGSAGWIAETAFYVPEPKTDVTDAIQAELSR